MSAEATRLIELIDDAARQLTEAGVSFGHGTTNAFDEAAWLVLWRLGLPLDTPLDGPESAADLPVQGTQREQVAALVRERIDTRKPAAERFGYEAVVGGIGGGREQSAVEEHPTGLVIDLVLVAAAARNLDDDLDAVRWELFRHPRMLAHMPPVAATPRWRWDRGDQTAVALVA